MATHFSILWTEQPGGLQSMGSQKIGHNIVTKHTHYSSCYSTAPRTVKRNKYIYNEWFHHLIRIRLKSRWYICVWLYHIIINNTVKVISFSIIFVRVKSTELYLIKFFKIHYLIALYKFISSHLLFLTYIILFK